LAVALTAVYLMHKKVTEDKYWHFEEGMDRPEEE